MKKITALLTLFVFFTVNFAGCFTVAAKNNQSENSGDWSYTLKSDFTAMITEYNGSGTVVSVPESLDGNTVSEIGITAFFDKKIESVAIPGCVKKIGWWAFYKCEQLKDVILADGINEISYGAFMNCPSLKSVKVPPTVYTIGNDAFGVLCNTTTGLYDYTSKKTVSAQYYNQTEGFTLIGYGGTAAEKYAGDSSVSFIGIDRLCFGDVNLDGVTDIADVILFNGYLEENKKLSRIQLLSADLNGDAKYDYADLELMKNYIGGQKNYSNFPAASFINSKYNYLDGLSMYCDGDSVAKGTGTNIFGNSFYSYCHYIRDKYNVSMTNKAVGGTTLAKQASKLGTADRSILERVEEMYGNYDIVLLNGGFNDLFQKIEIGDITPDSDKSGNYDEYTTIGALERICYLLNKNYKNSVKMFVICHERTEEKLQTKYWDAIRAVLDKWQMPYIDLSRETDFKDINTDIANQYFAYRAEWEKGDGIHPLEYANRNIYGPAVAEKLISLAAESYSFSFANSDVNIALSDTYTQQPVLKGYKNFGNIKWSSTNSEVASVDGTGVVKPAGKLGSAVIRAELDGTVCASYNVNVMMSPLCLFLNTNAANLEKGQSFQLHPEFLEGTASIKCEFSSSDTEVAKVTEKGEIKALHSGSAIIQCKTLNGLNTRCAITVF